jgi:hypothetical protein
MRSPNVTDASGFRPAGDDVIPRSWIQRQHKFCSKYNCNRIKYVAFFLSACLVRLDGQGCGFWIDGDRLQ